MKPDMSIGMICAIALFVMAGFGLAQVASPQIVGGPVFLCECNGSIAQQLVVQEVNDRHEIILRAGTKVIGVRRLVIALGQDPERECRFKIQLAGYEGAEPVVQSLW